MNQYIPPSEQLVNNTLPDLDQIHFLDYQLSIDFKNDLEDNRDRYRKPIYEVQFAKFGNLSKIELLSCLIPDNVTSIDNTMSTLYLKIDELGGRCYNTNHELHLWEDGFQTENERVSTIHPRSWFVFTDVFSTDLLTQNDF